MIMMESRRVLFILGQMRTGGAERVISILSKDYAKRGWETDICTLLSEGVEYDLNSTTECHAFIGNSNSRIRNLPYWLKTIRKHIRETNPDVIVSFAARINIIVILACMGLRKKIVVSERNDPRYDGRGIPTVILTKLLYPHTSCVVFQTKRAAGCFGKRVRKNSMIIPNPIEVLEYAANTDINKIVTVGSLKEQKNHHLLIDAFAKLNKYYPEKKLYIYGEGPLRPELEKQIYDYNLQERVFLAGQKSDVHNHISDAAFFVLSSDYEGLSNALLEAMMMGLPCISTSCAGSDEYILNEKNGLLTPVGDMNALFYAMKKYFDNEDLRVACGENARSVAEIVCTENTLKRWHEVIDI